MSSKDFELVYETIEKICRSTKQNDDKFRVRLGLFPDLEIKDENGKNIWGQDWLFIRALILVMYNLHMDEKDATAKVWTRIHRNKVWGNLTLLPWQEMNGFVIELKDGHQAEIMLKDKKINGDKISFIIEIKEKSFLIQK